MAIDYFAMASLGYYTEDLYNGGAGGGAQDGGEWMSLIGTWGAFAGAPSFTETLGERMSFRAVKRMVKKFVSFVQR